MRKPVYAIFEQQRDADQPAHLCSQISVFVIRCLDSITSLVSFSCKSPKTGFLKTWLVQSNYKLSAAKLSKNCENKLCLDNNFSMLYCSQASYHNDAKCLDRQIWANSVDPNQTSHSGSTLFAIPLHFFGCIITVMIISFRTDWSGQTVQTQIRLLLDEQSDQGLHCLPFCLHRLDALHCVSTSLYEF